MKVKNFARRFALSCLVVAGVGCQPAAQLEHYDLLIRNTRIVDGTGSPAFSGNVGIRGDRIVAVGDLEGAADVEIDGTDLVTAPGFVDPHSHADGSIARYPLAENLVMQGVTTFVGGNCGASPAPTRDWAFAQWLTSIEEAGLSVNYVPLVGHGTIRSAVMGADFKRSATEEEIEAMKAHVEEAMQSGAFGVSSFTDPSPAEYAALEELIAVAEVAGKHGGLYVPHTRHIQSQMPSNDPEEYGYGIYHGPIEDVWVGRYRGYIEAVEISRRANVPLHIAHFSNAYKIPQPHPDLLEEAAAQATLMEVIDKARDGGVDLTFDVIPFSASISGPLPLIEAFYSDRNVALAWVQDIETTDFLRRLETEEFRQRLRDVYDAGRIKLGMIHTKEDPYWMDCFRIVTCQRSEYEGMTVGEIARARNSDPLEVLFDLLVEDPEVRWVQFLDRRQTEASIPVFLKHPLAMPSTDMPAHPARPELGSDVYALYGELPSPIAYGLYPHYIGTYVREQGALQLEEAVRKATSAPAQRFGLADRGVLRPGAYADVVVFDLGTIQMKGDFSNPATPPDGIEYVIVNGIVTYKDQGHVGVRAGRILRHESSSGRP